MAKSSRDLSTAPDQAFVLVDPGVYILRVASHKDGYTDDGATSVKVKIDIVAKIDTKTKLVAAKPDGATLNKTIADTEKAAWFAKKWQNALGLPLAGWDSDEWDGKEFLADIERGDFTNDDGKTIAFNQLGELYPSTKYLEVLAANKAALATPQASTPPAQQQAPATVTAANYDLG